MSILFMDLHALTLHYLLLLSSEGKVVDPMSVAGRAETKPEEAC